MPFLFWLIKITKYTSLWLILLFDKLLIPLSLRAHPEINRVVITTFFRSLLADLNDKLVQIILACFFRKLNCLTLTVFAIYIVFSENRNTLITVLIEVEPVLIAFLQIIHVVVKSLFFNTDFFGCFFEIHSHFSFTGGTRASMTYTQQPS